MSSRDDRLDQAARALALGVERRDELIAGGRAEQAAREAGARTPDEIAAWVAQYAPQPEVAHTA